MKKRLFILLAALLCLVCIFALVACDETPDNGDNNSETEQNPGYGQTPHTHAWGEWITVTPATCTGQGAQTRICECGQSESGYIPALGHSFGEWESDNSHHWQTCTRAGCNEEEAKTAHIYDGENTCICSYYKGGIFFTLQNGTYAVTGYSGSESSVAIPSTYKGVAVTSIGEWAFCGADLTSITIPASVTSIGEKAFFCTDLTSITIPASVTRIGNSAFSLCSDLTTVTFAANGQLTSIGSSAFSDCDSLTSITIPASVTNIGSDAFSYLLRATFENPNGWWYASSDTATSGTVIPAADLSDPSTAAWYLTETYNRDYWKRT